MCRLDQKTTYHFTVVDSERKNEAALDRYRLGWAAGDTDIIIGVVTDTFNFTWVPDNDVVSKARFPSFFEEFKANAEADGRAKYLMRFDNIIHRQVRFMIDYDDVDISTQIGEILYEAADWIVDGFDRGSYFDAAKDLGYGYKLDMVECVKFKFMFHLDST